MTATNTGITPPGGWEQHPLLLGAVQSASALSYGDEDGGYYVVGQINRQWQVAHEEDMGLIAQMDARTSFRVGGDGPKADDFFYAMRNLQEQWQPAGRA